MTFGIFFIFRHDATQFLPQSMYSITTKIAKQTCTY